MAFEKQSDTEMKETFESERIISLDQINSQIAINRDKAAQLDSDYQDLLGLLSEAKNLELKTAEELKSQTGLIDKEQIKI